MDILALLIAQDPNAPALPWWPMYLVIGVMFYLIVFAPDRKRRQEQESMLGGLKKNDKVVTAGGIYGSIVSVADDAVVLRIDENNNTRIRVQRSSISRVLTDKAEDDDASS